MMTDTDKLKSEQGRIAALTRVARVGGRKISAPARAGFLAKFDTRHECALCGVIEIDQTLPLAEQAAAAAAAKSAHFRRMAQQRNKKRGRVDELEAQMAREDEALRELLREVVREVVLEVMSEAGASPSDELAVVDHAC